MKTVSDTIPGQILSEDLSLLGMATGSITVPAGRSLTLSGTIVGDLIVESGGAATVYGTVGGAVRNRGGDVSVFGIVGAVEDIAGTRTRIDPKAIIRNQ